jgi:hypothetical protein
MHAIRMLYAPALLALAVHSAPALAADSALTINCQARSLPTLAKISRFTGQHNAHQLYGTRVRLMAEVSRACRLPGASEIRLVQAPHARSARPGDRPVLADAADPAR